METVIIGMMVSFFFSWHVCENDNNSDDGSDIANGDSGNVDAVNSRGKSIDNDDEICDSLGTCVKTIIIVMMVMMVVIGRMVRVVMLMQVIVRVKMSIMMMKIIMMIMVIIMIILLFYPNI